MKKYLSNVKVSLFTLIMTFMLIGMIAVKGVTKKIQVPVVEPEIEIWYFIGDLKSDPLDPANYLLATSDNITCGGIPQVICEIQVPETQNGILDFNAESLVFGKTIAHQIAEANGSLTPNLTVKSFRDE